MRKNKRPIAKMRDSRYHVLMFVLNILSVLIVLKMYQRPDQLWWLMTPLSHIQTLVHEFWHALTTVFTFGHVHELVVRADGSGHVVSSGGFHPLIVMSGYTGTAIAGFWVIYMVNKYQWGAISYFVLVLAITVITLMFGIAEEAGQFTAHMVLFMLVVGALIVGQMVHWVIGTFAITIFANYLALEGINGLKVLGFYSYPEHQNDMEIFSQMFPILNGNQWAYLFAGLLAIAYVILMFNTLIIPFFAEGKTKREDW
jgi:hypothetical protein